MKKFSLLVLVAASAVTLSQGDSLNCRLVGSWPFGPAQAVAVDSARNLLYCGSGGGVYVLDVSNPAQPVKLSEAIHTRGLVTGLFLAAGRLYIADGPAGLEVWNVSTPSNPQRLGSCVTPDYAKGVAVAGSYAYVADYLSGLRVIDACDPAQPQEVGHCVTPDYAYGVAVADSHAYVADYSGLRVIDVSDPAWPREVGYCATPGFAWGVALAGSHAYVADYDSGLRVIDVSDPAQPREVGYCATPGAAEGVALAGSYAYVADEGSGLRVIDVSDPAQPREVGYYVTPGGVYGVAVAGSHAYVADYNGLRVIDISDPAHPQEVGYYATPGHAYSVAIAGNYAYVADANAGLQIVEFLGAGVEEGNEPEAARATPYSGPTIARGELRLPLASGVQREASSVLLDISGRKTLDLKPGPNDVSRLAPGVYFVREGPSTDGRTPSAIHKVILTR